MKLNEIANIIYEKDTASENTQVIVCTSDSRLWKGKAKDLKNQKFINDGWRVYKIDRIAEDEKENKLPEYNRSWFIYVI